MIVENGNQESMLDLKNDLSSLRISLLKNGNSKIHLSHSNGFKMYIKGIDNSINLIFL
jgi:hypothetical protein